MKKYVSLMLCLLLAALLFTGCAGGTGGSSGGGKTSDAAVNEALLGCFGKSADEAVKALGLRAVLATNPIFPAVATRSRIRWAGLTPEDFALYTTYENIGLCKPNPDYYREIMRRLDVRPEECLMVGNDATEDMAAAETGKRVFLLTDCLLNRENKDISTWPHGGFPQLMDYIESQCRESEAMI